MTDKLAGPNGLAFSPDEKKLYIAESRATPNRVIAAFDVGADGSISNRTVVVDANGLVRSTASASIPTATSGAAGAAMVRPTAKAEGIWTA